MTTNTSTISKEILIEDSQLTGFSALKQHLNFCCCRLFNKSSKYTLSKNQTELQLEKQNPAVSNEKQIDIQREKQKRNMKLKKIAESLPPPMKSSKTVVKDPQKNRAAVFSIEPTMNRSNSAGEQKLKWLGSDVVLLILLILFFLEKSTSEDESSSLDDDETSGSDD